MNKLGRLLLVAGACATVGCAHHPVHPSGSGTSVPLSSIKAPPTTAPSDPSMVALSEIKPVPVLKAPATQPAGPVPVEALELFAKARAALLDNRRFTAIGYLDRAIALDPTSFDLYYTLGEAYLGSPGNDDKSIAAFEKASDLRPNDVQTHAQLGRQYLAKGNLDKAIEHLRLAQMTRDYRHQEDTAAVVDYFLARALQRKSYDRAALDQYDALLKRLQNPTSKMRSNAELMFLINRPEILYVQLAELYEKHKQYDEALKAYSFAAEGDPANFDLQVRVVRSLVNSGKREDAARRAGEIFTRFKGDAQSLKLMREVYASLGRESAVTDEMMQLHRAHPEDRSILFGLVDLLKSQKKSPEARQMLEQAAAANRRDVEILRRLIAFYDEQNDTTSAARALIESLAADPEMLREISPFWSDLVRASRKHRLRISALQRLEVSPQAEAARQFLVSRMAEVWNRDALSRSSLEKAVKGNPPMAPAYRALLADIWGRSDWDEKQKTAESQRLAAQAEAGGNSALATELRALVLLNTKQTQAAADLLGQAIRNGARSPELQLNYAAVLRLAGNDPKAEQTLWALLADRPGYDDAYLALFNLYVESGSGANAWKVLQTWTGNDPTNVVARLLQAAIYAQRQHPEMAEAMISRLLNERPDEPQVLATAEAFYTRMKRQPEYISRLEDIRTKQPENRVVVEQLVEMYAQSNRLADALRVLDAARAAVKGDADLMYYISHLYAQIDQQKTANEILAEIIQTDPRNAPANNDLGYNLADSGKDLDRAEAMIRVAVDEEPDNQAFLDSFGWVLYKRSKFPEAQTAIEKALGPAARPDPVIVDHLGDIEYRLGQTKPALANWQRALQRVGEVAERGELKMLKLQLLEKIKQAQAGQAANVAPVVESPAKKVQQVLQHK